MSLHLIAWREIIDAGLLGIVVIHDPLLAGQWNSGGDC